MAVRAVRAEESPITAVGGEPDEFIAVGRFC
jgi:hypothetical protein